MPRFKAPGLPIWCVHSRTKTVGYITAGEYHTLWCTGTPDRYSGKPNVLSGTPARFSWPQYGIGYNHGWKCENMLDGNLLVICMVNRLKWPGLWIFTMWIKWTTNVCVTLTYNGNWAREVLQQRTLYSIAELHKLPSHLIRYGHIYIYIYILNYIACGVLFHNRHYHYI